MNTESNWLPTSIKETKLSSQWWNGFFRSEESEKKKNMNLGSPSVWWTGSQQLVGYGLALSLWNSCHDNYISMHYCLYGIRRRTEEKSPLVRNRKHQKVKFGSHLFQKKKKKKLCGCIYVSLCVYLFVYMCLCLGEEGT